MLQDPHLLPIDSYSVGAHPLVCRLMKGIFNKRPPQPCVVPIWSVSKVLSTLREWSPASKLDIKTLSIKTVMLFALATGKRCSSLNLLSVSKGFCEISESLAVLIPKGLEKHSRPEYAGSPIRLHAYNRDPSLCPLFYLKAYLKRTEPVRKCDSLFITVKKPH